MGIIQSRRDNRRRNRRFNKGPRDPAQTFKAAQLFAAIQPTLSPFLESSSIKVFIPRLTQYPDEDIITLNSAYHDQRNRPFNFSDQGYPAAIFLPTSAADVASLVKMLSATKVRNVLDERGVHVAVCGGAHGSLSMASNTICIDLSLINHVTVDMEKKLVKVGGGAKLGAVDGALHKTGYAVSTGTHPDTGVGGLTLVGGLGYLGNQAGMACDTLVEATVVLASGEIVVANDSNQHSKLMQALRGGGGNFGIVVEFTFEIFPVDPCFGGLVAHVVPTKERFVKSLTKLDQLIWSEMKQHQMVVIALPCKAPIIGTLASSLGPANGSVTSVKEIPFFATVRNLPGDLLRLGRFDRIDYHKKLQHLTSPLNKRTYATTGGFCIRVLDAKMIDTLHNFTHVDVPPSSCVILLIPIAGKGRTGIPGRPHSVGHRDNKYWLIVESVWNGEPAQYARVQAWTHRVMTAIKAQAGQATAHALDALAKNSGEVYAADIKGFLREAKIQYDPSNFFRMNVNISPFPDRSVTSSSQKIPVEVKGAEVALA